MTGPQIRALFDAILEKGKDSVISRDCLTLFDLQMKAEIAANLADIKEQISRSADNIIFAAGKE